MNLNGKLRKTNLQNLNKDSINSIEILKSNDNRIIATCSDVDINLYNVASGARHTLFPLTSTKCTLENEINCLKSFTDDLLLASNGPYVFLFDVNEQKLVNKLKFNKDTINCIDFSDVEVKITQII